MGAPPTGLARGAGARPRAAIRELTPGVQATGRGGDPLLGPLLRDVSRTFYLSLAILPRALRGPTGLAYLLARATATVADTRLAPLRDRLEHLETMRRAYAGEPADLEAVAAACGPGQSEAAERRLLARI